MTDEVRIFLACLATCPAVATFIVIMSAFEGNIIDDLKEAAYLWGLLTALFLIVVGLIGALTFVWMWAAP